MDGILSVFYFLILSLFFVSVRNRLDFPRWYSISIHRVGITDSLAVVKLSNYPSFRKRSRITINKDKNVILEMNHRSEDKLDMKT